MNDNTTNTKIDKPISVVIEDAKNLIIEAINGTSLHPTILEMVLKDIYNEVNEVAKAKHNREKAEYEQALMEQNNTTQESTEE